MKNFNIETEEAKKIAEPDPYLFTNKLKKNWDEYRSKLNEYQKLNSILNALSESDLDAPQGDLMHLLIIKEKAEGLPLSRKIKEEINSRFKSFITIFKPLVDLEPDPLKSNLENVNTIRAKVTSLLMAPNEKFNECLKEMSNKKLCEFPKDTINDLKIACLQKQGNLNNYFLYERTIIEEFVNIDEDKRSDLGTPYQIRNFEKRYAIWQEKLTSLFDNYDKATPSEQKDINLLGKILKRHRIPSKSLQTSIDTILARLCLSTDKKNKLIKKSPPLIYSYSKNIVGKPHIPPISLTHSSPVLSTKDNLNASPLEEILNKGIIDIKNIPGVVENNLHQHFETYKTFILDTINTNKASENAIRKIYDETLGILLKDMMEKSVNIKMAEVMEVVNNTNIAVRNFIKEEATKSNPLKKQSSKRI